MERNPDKSDLAQFLADVSVGVRLLYDGVSANHQRLAAKLSGEEREQLRAAAREILARLASILDAAQKLEAPTQAAQEAQKRILVVDDSEYGRDVAARVLRNMGFAVDEAASGQEAIERLRKADYALVLMDIQMPGMDGIQATQRIREEERGRSVPIVALTAVQFWESREECMQAGMSGFLVKPIRINELRTILDRLIGK